MAGLQRKASGGVNWTPVYRLLFFVCWVEVNWRLCCFRGPGSEQIAKRTSGEVLFYASVALGVLFGAAANATTDCTVNTSAFATCVASSKTTGAAVLATFGTDLCVKVVTVFFPVSCGSSLAASFSSSHYITPPSVVASVLSTLRYHFGCGMSSPYSSYGSGRPSPAPSAALKPELYNGFSIVAPK